MSATGAAGKVVWGEPSALQAPRLTFRDIGASCAGLLALGSVREGGIPLLPRPAGGSFGHFAGRVAGLVLHPLPLSKAQLQSPRHRTFQGLICQPTSQAHVFGWQGRGGSLCALSRHRKCGVGLRGIRGNQSSDPKVPTEGPVSGTDPAGFHCVCNRVSFSVVDVLGCSTPLR